MNFASMRNQSLRIVERFSPYAKDLRSEFDERFADPHSLDSNRFVWDYWHVPDHYTLLRTPAYYYFSPKLYSAFHKNLVLWGRRNLGCWDISPPWLSCYIDGCEQKLHADVPHGPWAFVLSLTPKPRFTGGETLLLKEQVLSYWKNFSNVGTEHRDFVEVIEPRFNRLLVFDGRIPHGVSRVEGVRDPRQGRLVIHGWFGQPKTYVEGALPGRQVERKLNEAFEQVQEEAARGEPLWGTLALQVTVGSSGKVRDARFLTASLRNSEGDSPSRMLCSILASYRKLKFKASRGETKILVPLLFS